MNRYDYVIFFIIIIKILFSAFKVKFKIRIIVLLKLNISVLISIEILSIDKKFSFHIKD